ncbi:synaptotagmin-like protein 2 isoform X2 [Hoplias malabaricus]|uniref:synaptotagmin-like protein 2 isoform X2 n=1 Tax=Hoplias malabaricus TaxID=27720 RepID=UPI0034636372
MLSKNEKTQVHRDHHPKTIEYEVTSRVGASLKDDAPCPSNNSKIDDALFRSDIGYSPPTFNINTKTNTKSEDYKQPLILDSHAPNPDEEHGNSIAKVLEWFSRSSDSSEKLDFVDSVQDMEDDMKIEDIDFEDAPRTKAEDNVYVIIPRQSSESGQRQNDLFIQDDFGDELNALEETQKGREQRFEPRPPRVEPFPVTGFSFQAENVTQKMDIPECSKEKGPDFNDIMLDNTDNKHTQIQLKETKDPEDNRPPKLANLKSFWEKGNAGPKILVSRSNLNTEKGNKLLNQNNFDRKVIDYIEEPPIAELALKENYAVPKIRKNASVKEDLNDDESRPLVRTRSKDEPKQETVIKDMQPSWRFTNSKKDRAISNSPDTDAPSFLPLKSSSPSVDSGSVLGSQSNDNVRGTMTINCSEGDCMSPAVLELEHRKKTEEPQAKSGFPPKSSFQQTIPIPLTKQSSQQQDNRAEKIKQLKLFWEKEKWEPRICVRSAAADRPDSSMSSSAKLNKRFTKSEFDLRRIGTESDEEYEENMPSSSGRESPNFILLPLRDKSVKADGINPSQFKTLREFWAGSSGKNSTSFEKNNQGPLSPEVKLLSPKAQTHKAMFQYPPGDVKFHLNQSGEMDNVRSSQFPQLRTGSQSSLKDTMPHKPPGMLNKGQRPQARRSSKGVGNGRGNSLRRATSMFAVNVEDEDLDQDLQTQSKPEPDTIVPQVRKAADVSMSPPRKNPDTNLQMKKSPETSRTRDKINEPRPSDSDPQPLARSFVPRDYQHYLGITENTDIFTPPQDTKQMSEMVCTSFSTSPEKGCHLRCSPVQASTPLSSTELRPRRGSQGPRPSAQSNDDVNHNILDSVDTLSSSRASSNCDEENPVQSALKRAVTRPMYHKSLEDITALPKPSRKSNQLDESLPNSYDNSSTPSPPSSSFSDVEHVRNLSKSVPSFLLDEVSGSVMSVYSGDFTSVEVQGTIQFSLNYVQKLKEFHIFIVQCQNLAAVDAKRNRSDPYVKIHLKPDSSNLGKRKTSVKKRTLNPVYNEILRYRVRMEYLKTQILNVSVWHNDTFARNSFLGEIEIDLSTWDFGNTKINSSYLKSRNTNSLQPADDRGEMRLAIRFLPQLTHSKAVPNSGEVHIWVKDCKNLPLIRGATLDPYVKCFVLPDTSKKSRQKTRVLKRTTNPVFNHTMVYDGFRAEDLKEACVELTVWDRDRLASHLLGGLRLGLGTGKSYGVNVDWMDSTPEEVALWEKMMDLPNEWVEEVLPLRMVTAAKNTRK